MRLGTRAPRPIAALHLGLVGAGIQGSPSPAMQQAALRARGLPGDYALIDVAPGDLLGVVRRLRTGELSGCNVTTPYKLALAEVCDRLEADAAVCRAVNTLVLEQAELVGVNTDARGLELALGYRRMVPETGSPGVILGAGGAAAAAALALRRMGVGPICVVARRPERAAELCRRVVPQDGRPIPWAAVGALRAAVAGAGVVVNATPLGLAGLPIAIEALPPTCVVADLRYLPRPVDLVEAARARGLRATDGAEMLLFQGMLSFQRWTAAEIPWHAAREALATALDR